MSRSGADISSMVNQAALKAGIDGVSSVNMSHLNYAKDKILMGKDYFFSVQVIQTIRSLHMQTVEAAFR